MFDPSDACIITGIFCVALGYIWGHSDGYQERCREVMQLPKVREYVRLLGPTLRWRNPNSKGE